MSQEDLAIICDICDSYLSSIECGRKMPSLEVIIKIAEGLDTSVDALLEGSLRIDSRVYKKELDDLLDDCTPYEKRVIYETVNSLKDSIRQNKALIIDEIEADIII